MLAFMRRRADWLVLALGIPVAAFAWVHLRPRVTVEGVAGGGTYLHDSHLAVFGSDAMFAIATAGIATIAAIVNRFITRRASSTTRQLASGMCANLLATLGVLVVGGFLGGGHPWREFPPKVLVVGQLTVEPARIHAFGVIFAGAIMWLLVMLVDAMRPHRPRQ